MKVSDFTFCAWQHICYSAYMLTPVRPPVPLSVPLSVTRVDQSKTVKVRITQLSPQRWGRFGDLRTIYQGCRALPFALAGLSCYYKTAWNINSVTELMWTVCESRPASKQLSLPLLVNYLFQTVPSQIGLLAFWNNWLINCCFMD